MPKLVTHLIDLGRSAFAAVWRELIEFRFVYPIDEVQEAMCPGTQRYYVYSTSLFQADLGRDERGVVVCNYRSKGQQYNPVFIAWCALFVGIANFGIAYAQVRIPATALANSAELQAAIKKGTQLESDQRWGAARLHRSRDAKRRSRSSPKATR